MSSIVCPLVLYPIQNCLIRLECSRMDGHYIDEGTRVRSSGSGWQFETLAHFPVLVEGPAWAGSGLLFTEINNYRIQRFDPTTGQCTVFREGTNQANGLMFDPDGKLYACEGGSRRMVLYD